MPNPSSSFGTGLGKFLGRGGFGLVLTWLLWCVASSCGYGATALFIAEDPLTQGSWKPLYGADGAVIVGDQARPPAYAAITASGSSTYTWAASSADPRALSKIAGADAVAGQWYAGGSFDVDVAISDGQAHRLSLYVLDWDALGRSERLDVLDAETPGNPLLTSHSLSGFAGGTYVSWMVSGHVIVRVTNTGPVNATISGVFLDAVGPAASATFVAADTTTHGNWIGTYGDDAANVLGDGQADPNYASTAISGGTVFTWQSPTQDERAPFRLANRTSRVAAQVYSATSFSVDIDVADGEAHQVALYALDWDASGRSQRFDITDATSGAPLDSRVLSSFSSGTYLVWTIRGHVTVTVTALAGPNATLSGIFFGRVQGQGVDQGTGTGLNADYFPNITLTGPAAVAEIDPQINFIWSGVAPAPGLPATNFSVRWRGFLQAAQSEDLTLITTTDDGVRLFLDGVLVIDDWQLQGATDRSYTFAAQAGRKYALTVEYYQGAGDASAELSWQSASLVRQPIPPTRLFPATAPGQGGGTGLSAAYYGNTALAGDPMLSRIDQTIDFAWNGAAPGPGVAATDFSVRWQGLLEAQETEDLTVITTTDDGVRLYLDDALVIDDWNLQAATDRSYTFPAQAGHKYAIRMEYYQHLGGSSASLSWQSATLPRQAVPQRRLYVDTLATPGSGSGLVAAYYPNETFDGDPAVIQVDPQINFTWGGASPVPGIAGTGFAVRWQGQLEAVTSEDLTLIATTDDGVVVSVGGDRVITDWQLQGPTDSTYTFSAKAGTKYDIVIDYYQHLGGAVAQLSWRSGSLPRQLVPSGRLYPHRVAFSAGTGLTAAYFPNATLSGAAAHTQVDATVDFAWNGQPPSAGVPGTDFSVRWRGKLEAPSTQDLTLITTADDGVRLYVDGTLAIDDWQLQGPTDQTYTLHAQAGHRYDITMEYYQHLGGATAVLSWQSDSLPRQVIPQIYLYPLPVYDVQPSPGVDQLVLAVGDTANVTSAVTGTVGVYQDSGTSALASFPITAGGTYAIAPTTPPGAYLYRTVTGGPDADATLAVTVVDTDLGNTPIADQFGFTRQVSVHVWPATAPITFVSSDPGLLRVGPATIVNGVATFAVTAISGSAEILAQIQAPTGTRTIASRPVDGFALDNSDDQYITVTSTLADGSQVAQTSLTMDPLVPGLDMTLTTFSAGLTFDDNSISRTVPTATFTRVSGPDGASGTYSYQLIRAPTGYANFCHSWVVRQNGVIVSF